MSRVGVVLLNLGGPERIQDVGPFLFNLFADPEIIRLPIPALQKPLGLVDQHPAKWEVPGGLPLHRRRVTAPEDH